jgi:hypothetical protein
VARAATTSPIGTLTNSTQRRHAQEDVTKLRELRDRLLPGRSRDRAWGEETYGAGREWYNEIALAFTHGVPEADGKPLPGWG